jgi:hypothetical protein
MTPKLYMASTFLPAYARLPIAQQRKMNEFLEKFQANPTLASINYEPIHGVRDPRVRTVRIDKTYRAVLLHPDKGADYVMVWVDHHDEAMDWARNKEFSVHPVTGSLQVLDLHFVEGLASQSAAAEAAKSLDAYALFETVSGADLLRVGVPLVLLSAVRALATSADLDLLQPYLPQEAYERLYYIAEGCSVDQALEYAGVDHEAPVDPTDLAAALAHPDSQRRFHLLETATDLESILGAPMEKWRVFLHPSQERLVTRSFQGPARVLGGAGTGKTVVAMHRARHLARSVFTAPGDRILFTTYTRNLAINIQQNLQNLCGPEIERIDVVNLHAWVMQFLNRNGRRPVLVSEEESRQCWRNAVERSGSQQWSEAFLRREWEVVVQGQVITDRAGYLRAPRQGQLRALSRAQRDQIWPVFAAYRAELDRLGKVEWQDLIREAGELLAAGHVTAPYKSIVVDETQDLTAEELRLLRRMVLVGPNDLFFVGDAHQRIYGYPIVMQHCSINIRGRSARLRINYRTTEEIRKWATAVLSGIPFDDLDGGDDTLDHYHSLLHGFAPVVRHFSTFEEESDFLIQELRTLCETAAPETICLVARTHEQLRSQYLPLLRRGGINHLFLDKDTPDYVGSGIRLATMHRVKGLEFAHVLLVGACADYLPPRGVDASDADLLQAERCLIHVAATRARETLTVTSWGTPSTLLCAPA